MEIPSVVENPIEIIQMLSAVSERISEYVNNQQYLEDVDSNDVLDENSVITQCYLILIGELEEKGIRFETDDLEELLSNYADSERIYHLYEWIDTRYQIILCKTHKQLIPLLENILNTEDSEDDTIVQWARAVYPLVSDTDPHLTHCLPILQYTTTDQNFEDLLQYIYVQVENIVFEFQQPLSVITDYSTFMLNGQENAKKAYKVLLSSYDVTSRIGIEYMEKLQPHLNQYDMAKVAPECISDYAWAWTIETGYKDAPKKEELPPSLQEQYEKLELAHHTTTDHHIEYYLANRDVPMDHKAILLLVVACYAPKDPTKTQEKCENVLAAAGDRMDEAARNLFSLCSKILVAYAGGEIQ